MRVRASAVVCTLLTSMVGVAGGVPAGAAQTVDVLVPLVPTRILDTRIAVGADGPVGPNDSISLDVTGIGGVPANGVGAVVLNVTAARATTDTWLTVFPHGQVMPETSNMNVTEGFVAANSVVATVGDGGLVDVYNFAGSVELIVDVTAWLPAGGGYTGFPPQRLLDTRVSGDPLGADASIDVQLAGRAGVPASGVGAVVVSVTATQATANTFLTVWPSDQARPATSNLNPLAGRNASNAVVASLSADGRISVYNSTGSTHVIVDVFGWLPVGGGFARSGPARILDTRSGLGQPGPVGPASTFSLDVTGVGGVPPTGVGAVVLNLTASQATEVTFVTAWPSGQSRPTASSLNPAPGGVPVANLVVAAVGNDGSIELYNDAGSIHLIADVVGWFAAPSATTNQSPVAVDDTATTDEDSPVDIAVLVNDTDADGDSLVVSAVGAPSAGGTVVITSGGSAVSFDPGTEFQDLAAGESRATAFTYTVSDGVATDTATATVTVTGVADDPTAVGDAATVAEGAAATAIDVLANDTDPDGGPKMIDSTTDPANGVVVITGGGSGLTYEPDPGYCNTPPGTSLDTFTYTLTPGGSTATVTLTVTCFDDPPTAVDDTATVGEDSGANDLGVLVNDTDVDGGPKTVVSTTDPVSGTVVITGGGTGLTYQPDLNVCNDPPGTTPDTFTYTLNGGSTATVAVKVTCVDDPPVAVDDTATVGEDSAANAIDVLANDTDVDGGPMTIQSTTDPANGAVAITGGGTGLTYQPDANYCNDGTPTDDFTYTLDGGSIATVAVTVTCVPDDPTAVDDTATVGEDSGANAIDVLANDTDPDAGPASVLSTTDPANGTVAITGGGTGVTYTPDPDYCNDGVTTDDFTYTLNGGSTATVAVTVACVDDNPVAVDDTFTTAEDTALDLPATGVGSPADNDLDADAGDTLSVIAVANPAGGTVALAAGTVTFTPTANLCGAGAGGFDYTVSDGVSPTDDGRVTVDITCVNDPPTAVDDTGTTDEDTTLNVTTPGVLANDTDVDSGDTKTVVMLNGSLTLTGTSVKGAAVTINADGSYSYDPGAVFQGLSTGESDTDSFTYTMADGAGAESTATVNLTIDGVSDAPTATTDRFDAIGNTALFLGVSRTAGQAGLELTGSVLENDLDPDTPPTGLLVEVVSNAATTLGGTVSIAGDGTFVYHPDDGDTAATDTFTYRVCDASPCNSGTVANATGTVEIDLAGQVWYVRNNATAGGDGTSDGPFDTLVEAEAASGAGDTVFVFDGDNTSTGLATGYAMDVGERLIGEHEGLVVDPDGVGGVLTADTLLPANPGAYPTLTASNEDVVDLDDGNEVRGFNIDPSGTGGGIAGTTGDTGGGTIDDVNIVDTGTAGAQPALELDATTGTFTITNLVIDNTAATSPTSTATGVRLNSAGTVVFDPASTITITTAGAKGFDATATNLGTSTIDAITVTGSPVGGVSLTATTGTIALGDETGTDLNLTTTGGTGLFLSHAGGTGVTVGAGGTDEIHSTGGPAIDITGSGNFAFDDVDSANSTGDGINLASFGGSGFTAGSGSTISGVTAVGGVGFDLDGGNGAVTFDGTITTSGSGRSVEVTNRTGATVDFNGLITDNGAGINLSTNGAGLVRFDGGINASTGANTAFNATAGGNVAVTDANGATAPNNTLTTTTGTALNVQNTTIHSDDLAFQSISSNGASSGIVLASTGSSGGLTVTGNGGTCSSAANCTGGAIQNSTGAGISMTNVGGGVSLTRVSVNNGGDDGIRGNAVAGLSLANSVVLTNGNAVDERGLDLFDLTGSGGISSSTISGSSETNVRIENNTSTALTAFNVTGSTISQTTVLNGDTKDDGILVLNDGAGAMTVSVTGNTFTDNKGDHFQAASDADASGSIDVTFDDNTLTTTADNDPNVVGGGITISTSGTLDINFHIGNNNIQQAFDDAINLNLAPASQVGANFVGTVTGNTIGTTGVLDSGSESSNAVTVGMKGAGTAIVAVTNNNVRQFSNAYGIFVGATEGSPVVNATVTGNTVKEPGTFALNGIRVDAGATAGPPVDAATVCVNLSGNDATGSAKSPPSDTDIRLRQRFSTTIRLPGYVGANSDTTAVNTFVSASNTGAPTVSSVHNVGGGGGGFVGGAACATP